MPSTVTNPALATFAASLHRHLREDEHSYVLEGKVAALLGDEVLIAGRRG
jgi:uncharacterized cupin superfamily protein